MESGQKIDPATGVRVVGVCVLVYTRAHTQTTWVLDPAKKWGDTKIAERGRSVLVMRARYRSAGLIPHQRGWTDAG